MQGHRSAIDRYLPVLQMSQPQHGFGGCFWGLFCFVGRMGRKSSTVKPQSRR